MDKNTFRKSSAADFAPPPACGTSLADRYIADMMRQDAAKQKRADVSFKRFVAVLLSLIFIGTPLLGLGLGVGIQLANNYFLPSLLNDSAQRENFSFENVHNPVGQVRQFDGALAPRGDYVELVNSVKSSVVTITATVQMQTFLGQVTARTRAGTGILMYETQSRYYIATNAHVIEGAAMVTISIDGSPQIQAIPIGRDDDNDLAVIAIYKSAAIQAGVRSVNLARFGDSNQSQVGERVIAIGNALGEGISVTNGIISALDIDIYVDGMDLNVMQTNAAINRGNSGGPLLNMLGEVIGINTAKVYEQIAEGMGYAIPSSVAKPILEGIMRQTAPPAARPTVGISGNTWTAEMAEDLRYSLINDGVSPEELIVPDGGFMVTRITTYRQAYLAGMRLYDIITHIDGVEIQIFEDLAAHMQTRSMGDVSVFTVVRGGVEMLDFSVTLGSYFAERF